MKRMRYSPTKIADTYLIGEQSLKRIADTTGTPLYLYDKRKIKEQWGKLKSFLPDFVDIYYSVKANPNRKIVDYINNLGGNFETASLGEMNIVTQYDDKQKIIVGPGKTTQEIDFALTHGFYIVAESINEIKRINQICFERQIITKIAIRINPGYSNGLISMGGNTQFGMAIKTVHELSMIIRDLKNIKINGLHFYLATGILSTSQIVENLKQVIKTIDTITKCLKFELEVIDVGGGLGIPYYEEDKNLDLSLITEEYDALISNIVIQSDMDHSHLDNARELAQDLNKELIEIHLETIPHSIVDAMKKADKHEKFHSDGLDTMRMKCSLRTCVLSFYQDHGYTIFGTTNRTEYEMGFFLPFGDGIADIKPILHMYKSQIKKIAEVLGTREKVLKQPASAGFWVGEEDLDDMAWWLYNEKPITEEIISDESIVNYVENLKQQLSTKKIDDILYSLSRHEDHMTISEENSIDIEIVEKFSKLKSASKKFKHREYNKSLL